jgi:hypothetical protein
MTQPKTYVWMNDCATFQVGRSDVGFRLSAIGYRQTAKPGLELFWPIVDR